jgi:transcriptional antiterminator RfaH
VSVDVDRQRWRCINGTLGVKSLIMCGQRPLPVPIGIVETLVSATDEAGILRSTSLLKPGSRVRVIAGSLMDRLGVLDSLDGRGAASVLIAIMGRQVSVSISRDHIVPLS